MSDIIVFEKEKVAGLEDQIRSKASVAYVSQLYPPQDNPITLQSQPSYAKALDNFFTNASKDDGDIYHTYSILVSTTWNKNDDVFGKDEVWAARNTPQYKPANLEHDEKKIVGGIIGNWPVDTDFNLIDNNASADHLPDPYHILVASVIYRQWQDPEYQTRAEELIEKIERGDMFVSMECVFRGFDYAVVTPDGNNRILARNEETSFLSKHLRSYGGTGSYQDHKVGRFLKSITFSGKGFVEKPANPESVIFDKNHIFNFTNASSIENLFSEHNGVSIKVEKENLSSTTKLQENSDMSNEVLNDQIKELKEQISQLQVDNTSLADKLSKANVDKWETQVNELNASLESYSTALTEAQNNLNEANSKTEELETKLAEEVLAREEIESQLQELEKERVKVARVSSLVAAGLSEEDALAKIETLNSLSEEQFNDVVNTIAEFNTASPGMGGRAEEDAPDEDAADEATDDSDEGEADASVDEEVLETADVEEAIDMSVAAEEQSEELQHVRSGLQDWVNSYVLKNESGE